MFDDDLDFEFESECAGLNPRAPAGSRPTPHALLLHLFLSFFSFVVTRYPISDHMHIQNTFIASGSLIYSVLSTLLGFAS